MERLKNDLDDSTPEDASVNLGDAEPVSSEVRDQALDILSDLGSLDPAEQEAWDELHRLNEPVLDPRASGYEEKEA